MVQKRKIKRNQLIYYLKVFDKVTGNLLGHLINISPDGIMLSSEHPLEINKVYDFEMILPEGVEPDKKMSFNAKCLWCKKDVNPDFYASGFETRNISVVHIKLILNLINKYGTQI